MDGLNSGKRIWLGALGLALIHLVLAMLFASRTPFMTPGRVFFQGGSQEGIYTIDIGAPDELQHVVHIGRVATEPYPVLDPKDPKMNMNYEALQPPLYYYLSVGWAKLLGASTASKFAIYLKSNSYENAEQMLKDQSFFTQINRTPADVKQDGMRLRLLNAIIGALTILGVFALGLWGTGNRFVAFAAAAFSALLPMNIALSGAVSNDPLLICLSTWAVAYLALVAREGLCVKRGLMIGGLIGLAFLTKTTALALIPVVLFAMVFCRKTLPFRVFVPGLVLALALGGFWWAKNQATYGDPFAIKIFNEAFQGRNPTAESFISRMGTATYWESVFTIMGMSFIGVFSYMDIYLEPWVYTVYKWLFIIFGLIGLGVIFTPTMRADLVRASSSDEDDEERSPIWPTHLINGVFLIVMLLLFVQFNRGFFQAQARYIMPAIGPIGCLLGLGVAWLCAKGRTFVPVALWILILLIPFAQAAQSLTPGFKLRVEKGIPYP